MFLEEDVKKVRILVLSFIRVEEEVEEVSNFFNFINFFFKCRLYYDFLE